MKVVFKPSPRGLPKVVSGAERPILELLWEKGPLTGREIYEHVRHPRTLAYTTVLTLVGRMIKKGIVRRQRVDGLFKYEAALEKAEFEKQVAEAVVKGILEMSPTSAVSTFVDVISEWDEGKLDEVMEIIEKKRKAEG